MISYLIEGRTFLALARLGFCFAVSCDLWHISRFNLCQWLCQCQNTGGPVSWDYRTAMASNVRVRQTSHRKAAHPKGMGRNGSETTRDRATLKPRPRPTKPDSWQLHLPAMANGFFAAVVVPIKLRLPDDATSGVATGVYWYIPPPQISLP